MKKILVFSNGEKIGDGIIKLPLLHEIKKRLPNYKLIWATNLGSTVYNKELKNIAKPYIHEIIEKVNLRPFFWNKISNKYQFKNQYYDFIFDTQKAVFRTAALKRIKCHHFISATANGLFSTVKVDLKKEKRNYYLDDLFDLLNLIKYDLPDNKFKIPIPFILEKKLKEVFNDETKYIGIAPGAGEKDKIWPLKNFIKVGKFFQEKNFKIVLYLGPSEINLKEQLLNEFPEAILPEEIIKGFSNIEIIISSTKFLSCAIANDSGVSHMLSSRYCPLIKLFGPKDSNKFTPYSDSLKTISAKEYDSKDVAAIPFERVIDEVKNILKLHV